MKVWPSAPNYVSVTVVGHAVAGDKRVYTLGPQRVRPSPLLSLLVESWTGASVVEEGTPSSETVRLKGAKGSRTVERHGSRMSSVKVSVSMKRKGSPDGVIETVTVAPLTTSLKTDDATVS